MMGTGRGAGGREFQAGPRSVHRWASQVKRVMARSSRPLLVIAKAIRAADGQTSGTPVHLATFVVAAAAAGIGHPRSVAQQESSSLARRPLVLPRPESGRSVTVWRQIATAHELTRAKERSARETAAHTLP